jgi:hypothetical protein
MDTGYWTLDACPAFAGLMLDAGYIDPDTGYINSDGVPDSKGSLSLSLSFFCWQRLYHQVV